MRHYFNSLFLLLTLLCFSLHANTELDELDYSMEMVLDPSHKLTLEEIRSSAQWLEVPQRRLGFSDHTVWFHISIHKKHPLQHKYILRYNFTNIENLIAYEYINNQQTQKLQFGVIYPPSSYHVDYEYFLTPLTFNQNETIEYYIKINHFGSVPTSFTIFQRERFLQEATSSKLFDGLLYGILLVMIFYNLVLYLFTRLNYYLYYISLVSFSLLYQTSIRGLSTHYIWPNMPLFAGISDTLFALLFIEFGALFIIKLLDLTMRQHPKILKLLYLEMFIVGVLLSLVIFFELTHINNALGLYLNSMVMLPILALFVTIILIAYYLALKHNRTAILFSIAWSFFTLAIIVYVLQIWGVLPGASWGNNLLAIGSVSEVVLLALILADKINALNRDNINLEYTNNELEHEVNERTKELQHQLYMDQLTGLKNRFSLIRALSESEINVIMLIDIDDFSQTNDLYGIPVGNKILKHFAHVLDTIAKEYYLECYRIGADEFVLLAQPKEDYNIDDYLNIAHQLHDILEADECIIEEINDVIDISTTIALVHGEANLLNKADMTISTARSENQKVMLYQDALDRTHQLQKNLYYKKEIRLALLEDRFTCFFQPIVSHVHQRQKYELLMRLKQIENGEITYISPYEFLSISIKTKQYEALSRHILEKGMKTVQDIDCDLSVNLSYIEIKNPEFRVWFIQTLEKYNMFERIILEILEDEHLENYSVMKDFCNELQGYGARIAIDDFGSGFSNFTHILELRPEYIKIDGSIIKNIHTDAHSYSLVKAIVSLSKEIGATTIAEFVHSKEVLDIVKELGVDEFQGFYIAEPQPLF